MCRVFPRVSVVLAAGALSFVFCVSSALAAVVFPVDKDINAEGLGFGGLANVFDFGGFGVDDAASFMGNDILVQTAGGAFSGAGFSLSVSNGENGYTETFDSDANVTNPPPPNNVTNEDVDNTTPPNPVWTTIGNSIPPANPTPPNPVTGTPNPRVGLNNGNVIRFSLWVREDPNDPITVVPQIEPVLKFEFWKEGLSSFADTNPGTQPFYADKVVDTDQHLNLGTWIDLDNDGIVSDPFAATEGRIRTISSTDWTLIDVEYEVDDFTWFGIDDDIYTVADIEDVRASIFWGDFLGGASPAGSLWFDNALVEVFADQAAANASPVALSNPSPLLDEGDDADFDNDGDVDGADFLIWQRGVGVGTQQFEGDADFSGTVDGDDLVIWQNQYGTSGLVSSVAAVPEPASCWLLLLGALCLKGAGRRIC